MTYIEPDVLRDLFFDALDDDTFQVSKFWDNLHGNVTGEDACEIGNTIIAILQEAIKEKEEEIEAQQDVERNLGGAGREEYGHRVRRVGVGVR